MDVSTLLNKLGKAVADAKAKADTVAQKKAELAALVAERQADIDRVQQAYLDAKATADQLQAEAREAIGAILPAPDARFRVSA